MFHRDCSRSPARDTRVQKLKQLVVTTFYYRDPLWHGIKLHHPVFHRDPLWHRIKLYHPVFHRDPLWHRINLYHPVFHRDTLWHKIKLYHPVFHRDPLRHRIKLFHPVFHRDPLWSPCLSAWQAALHELHLSLVTTNLILFHLPSPQRTTKTSLNGFTYQSLIAVFGIHMLLVIR